MKKKITIFVISLIFLLGNTTFAYIEITEVMYDLPNADSGREWIEVLNNGDANVDLTTHKLFEANVNHLIKSFRDSQFIYPGQYAVIADNPQKFLQDWPNYKGLLFDSSFSLSNTGESLSIKNQDGVEVDLVIYDSNTGASGDGNSLQKINGIWSAQLPTPGSLNLVSKKIIEKVSTEIKIENKENQKQEIIQNTDNSKNKTVVQKQVYKIEKKKSLYRKILDFFGSLFG